MRRRRGRHVSSLSAEALLGPLVALGVAGVATRVRGGFDKSPPVDEGWPWASPWCRSTPRKGSSSVHFANGRPGEQPASDPARANVHEIADRALCEFAKAIPYGVYDLGND